MNDKTVDAILNKIKKTSEQGIDTKQISKIRLEILGLLSDPEKDMDTDDIQILSLGLDKIKETVKDDNYIELLDDIKDFLVKLLIGGNKSNNTKKTTKNKKVNTRILGDKINKKVNNNLPPINDIQDFENLLEINFEIKGLEESNYSEIISDMLLMGSNSNIGKNKLIEILKNIKSINLSKYNNRHKNAKLLLIEQITNKLEYIKNQEKNKEMQKKMKEDKEIIKKDIRTIILNIEEFKATLSQYIKDNNILEPDQLNLFENGTQENTSKINEFIVFLRKKLQNLSKKNKEILENINNNPKLSHTIDMGLNIYDTIKYNQVKLGLQKGFFWGDIDELITALKKELN